MSNTTRPFIRTPTQASKRGFRYRFLTVALLIPVILASSESAQAQDLTVRDDPGAGVEQPDFERLDLRLGRQIRAFRFAGWTLFGAGSSLLVLVPALLEEGNGLDSINVIYNRRAAYGVGVSGGILLIAGSALLFSSRLRVGRRQQLRDQRDRAYFHTDLDFGVSPRGVSFHLAF